MKCTVGVDMGGTRIKIGLVENGKILHATGIDVRSALLEDHLIDLQDAIQSLL
jgi:predicted NBD/HSP70 family sugar kinase